MAREPWPRRPAPYDRPMNRRLWIWRHFRFWLPEDWEMLQFTRHSAVGRCAFADRYAFRLEINWRAVAGPPDFELMLRNYVARLREEGHERLRPIRRAGWRGVASQKNDLACSRFGAYFDAESCLVEMVFLWPGIPTAPELEKEILESVAESPPDAAAGWPLAWTCASTMIFDQRDARWIPARWTGISRTREAGGGRVSGASGCDRSGCDKRWTNGCALVHRLYAPPGRR